MNDHDYYDTRGTNLNLSEPDIIHFFEQHPLLARTQEMDSIYGIRFVQDKFIDFSNVGFNAYLSAILTDFLRQKFIESRQSFTFESVMSSPDKLHTLS